MNHLSSEEREYIEEEYLKKYTMHKQQIEAVYRDLDEMLEQRAAAVETGFTNKMIPVTVRELLIDKHGRPIKDKNGRIQWEIRVEHRKEEVPIIAHSGMTSDSTATKVISLIRSKEDLKRNPDFQELRKKVEAVEMVAKTFKGWQLYGTERQKEDAEAKGNMLIDRYMGGGLKDAGVRIKLEIPERTYYRWKNDIIDMVAENLQFLGSKLAV